jgi:CDP-paratose 2-epimerase
LILDYGEIWISKSDGLERQVGRGSLQAANAKQKDVSMKVLITGGCGFLGSNIACSYLQEGASVVVIDNLSRVGAKENLRWLSGAKRADSKLVHHSIDLADGESLRRVVSGEGPFSYVCHLAGQVAMTTSIADPIMDFRSNALGTLHLLEAVRATSAGAMIAFSSTNKVYGDLAGLRIEEGSSRYVLADFPMGLDESLPLDFASPYGCSKGAADQYVRDWARTFGMSTVVFRHSSIYGGRQFATADQGWVGWFCEQAVSQRVAIERGEAPKPFTIAGNGKQVRDVLHADDLVRLYRSAYEHRDSISGRIFNVGGGVKNSLSLLELFAMLEAMLEFPEGQRLAYRMMERRKSDQDVFVADIASIQRATGWEPTVAARDGIERMVGWARVVLAGGRDAVC